MTPGGPGAVSYHQMRRTSSTAARCRDVASTVPSRADIDLPLVIGAGVLGIGWGLGGLCPGPSIVAAAAGSPSALGFVVAMLAGTLVRHRLAGAHGSQ